MWNIEANRTRLERKPADTRSHAEVYRRRAGIPENSRVSWRMENMALRERCAHAVAVAQDGPLMPSGPEVQVTQVTFPSLRSYS
jgi:hypothetical protein